MGDCHLTLHSAFHPANSRRHSAGSLERCGVLPKTPVGEAAGDQCELYKVGWVVARIKFIDLEQKHMVMPHLFGTLRNLYYSH